MNKAYIVIDPTPEKLNQEIIDSASLDNYYALTTDGNNVVVHFDAFISEAALDLVMTNHVGEGVNPSDNDNTEDDNWHLTSLTLGDAKVNNNVTIYDASNGAGYLYTVAESGEMRWNIPLKRNGLNYDGSDIKVSIIYQLFSATGVNDEMEISGKALFTKDGVDGYSDAAQSLGPSNWSLAALNSNERYTKELFTFSGNDDTDNLQFSIKRENLPVLNDYSGDFDIYAVIIEKV